MSQNLDKNKICESIRKSRPQDLLLVTVNPADKDSKKNALAEIEKFIGKGGGEIIIKKI
jgi:hypothetical protein